MRKCVAWVLVAPLALIVSVLAGSPSAVSPGVIFEFQYTQGTQPPQTGTASIEGEVIKMTMPSGEPGEPNDAIFRGDRREMVIVNHSEESYIVMDEATIKQIIAQMGNAMSQLEEMLKNVPEDQRPMVEQMMKARGMGPAPAASPEPELRPTADTATHSGFATRKYEVYVGGRKTRELWVTDWDNIEGFQEARPAFESMASFMQDLVDAMANSPMGGSMNMNSNGYEFMSTLNGFPVLTREFDENGEVDSETLLLSATQQTIDPADLEPPPTYTLQQLPGLPG